MALSNADFQTMLRNAPVSSRIERPSPKPSANAAAAPKVDPAEAKRKREMREKKRQDYMAALKERKAKQEEKAKRFSLEAAGYRDRAKERRTEEFGGGTGDAEEYLSTVHDRTEAIEKSKFLGGDMEHTHLVKGLDYALLAKIRDEIVKAPEPEEPDKETKIEPKAPETVSFKSHIAKNVYLALQEIGKQNAASSSRTTTEQFLPYRTSYIYELHENVESDIPTTVHRSKEDCPSINSTILGLIDPITNEKIEKILTNIRDSIKQRKMLRKQEKKRMREEGTNYKPNLDLFAKMKGLESLKEHFEEPEPVERRGVPLDEEEDIFPDAGNVYKPVVKKSKVSENKDYFTKDNSTAEAMDIDESTNNEASALLGGLLKPGTKFYEPNATHNTNAIFTRGNSKESYSRKTNESVEASEKDASAVPDVYSECYPASIEGHADVVVDSDDEDEADFTKMDTGIKSKLQKWDFDSEQNWEKYMQTREATPQAAFQFGVKLGAGRKNKRKLQRRLKSQQNG